MNDETYEVWTNYATWCVNLDMIMGLDPREAFSNCKDVYDLASDIRQYCRKIIEKESIQGLARDYALRFMNEVDWLQIADRMAEYWKLFQTETELA
jgi:hypothetical protein